MIRRVRITDITRMGEPRVCVAGYDESGACIRPVLHYGQINERDLELPSGLITPFAEIEYDLTPAPGAKPHVEDHFYSPESVRWVRSMDVNERHALLHATRSRRVDEAFGAPLVHFSSHFVRAGSGTCSLVTIQTRGEVQVQLLEKEGKPKWRLVFCDVANHEYNLPITDLTWIYFAAVQQRYGGADVPALERRLNRILQKEEVFVRLGLAREYPRGSHQCWLQVNAIYTFPDYLEGRTFAEYRAGLAASADA